MTRHLLPDEIDQLLDGEVGFGIAPLEAHVRDCETCRAELETGRQLVASIEHLPRLAPAPAFTERVMAQVNVYEPWDVAARDTVARWVERLVPSSRPVRIAAGALGLSVATVLSLACVWLVSHLDAVFFVSSLVRTRARDVLLEGFGVVLSTVFGPQSIAALERGSAALILGLLVSLAAAVVVVAVGVRSIVVSSSRRDHV